MGTHISFLLLLIFAVYAGAQNDSIVYRLKPSRSPNVKVNLSDLTGLDPKKWSFKIISPQKQTLRIRGNVYLYFDRRKFKDPCVIASPSVVENATDECVLNVSLTAQEMAKPFPMTQQISAVIQLGYDNDFTPQIFVTGAQDAEMGIFENEPPGIHVATVYATDRDKGDAGEVSCILSRRNRNKFRLVNAGPGVYLVNTAVTFDRERAYGSQVTFYISCRDNGSPSKKAIQAVALPIKDVNDNAPKIRVYKKRNPYKRRVCKGSVLGTIRVSDADDADAGKVTCKANGDSLRVVKLHRNYHKVVSTVTLNVETRPRFTATIVCVDHGDPQQKTSMKWIATIANTTENTFCENSRVY